MLNVDLPDGHTAILSELEHERLITQGESGRWNITNLGAVLFANRLGDFPSLLRKATRVITYRGGSRIETIREQVGGKGYAAGFEGLISYINEIVPANEVIEQALRTTVPMYPELALRELTANALIHQDFSLGGTGPLVEVFDSRVEITNPGRPLMDIQRLLDKQPRSRNEKLAHLMRRLGICEERGSGIDKVVHLVELFQLPAPLFEVPDDSTRVVLFAHRPVQGMDKAERVRACYFHACLEKVNHEYLTNSSLRERFGIEQKNSSVVSRWIKEAVDEGAICPADEQASRKQMKYVPWWAVTQPKT